jgi:hypothetical protein
MKVLGFHMSESIYVPGVGMMKDSVTPQFYPGLEAHLDAKLSAVYCRYKGKAFLIPIVRCEVILIEEPTTVH